MSNQRKMWITIWVSALGYFVDIYDLLLFGIVRVESLRDLQVPEANLMDVGGYLLSMQMLGVLIGGIFWGMLGDKRGRISVLFGSIFLYSLGNIANGFVQSVESYGLLRLITGIGLAGELGAAVTLVSEIMTKEKRGIGTTIIAGVGVLGAVVAALIAEIVHWRTAFFIGGGLGFLLLLMRVGLVESGMFVLAVEKKEVKRGDFTMILFNRKRLRRYLHCVFIGVPIWFVIGILATFAPEFAKELGVVGEVTAGRAIMYTYIGLTIGDLGSGFLSQHFRSRKKIFAAFIGISAFFTILYLASHGISRGVFYFYCLGLGIGVGYWAIFVANSAEQFGTNLRATVTTTTPNFVRGTVPLISFFVQMFTNLFGLIWAASLVGGACFLIAICSWFNLEETFARDLDFWEENEDVKAR